MHSYHPFFSFSEIAKVARTLGQIINLYKWIIMVDDILKLKPREQNGRDTLSRYRAQIRAAGIASLSILEGSGTVRVYCDYHDDFVVEKKICEKNLYTFIQVKTKEKLNTPWGLNDVFGILKKPTVAKPQIDESITNSFIGKMLTHTINFPNSCDNIIFMTNIHLDDAIEEIINDIKNQSFKNSHVCLLINKFNSCVNLHGSAIDINSIKEKISKIKFESDVQYIKQKDNNFESIAREKIYEYSEIDLEHSEANEILLVLLKMVEDKSSGIIYDLSPENIIKKSSIGIDELLDILSISKAAYYELLKGGDPKAIKSASVIERTLRNAGATSDQIEFASRCKTKWDLWIRNNRHIISELDTIAITESISKIIRGESNNNQLSFKIIKNKIDLLLTEFKENNILYDLDKDTLCGGIFSEIVRLKS